VQGKPDGIEQATRIWSTVQRLGRNQSCLLLTSREKPREIVPPEGQVLRTLLPGTEPEADENFRYKGIFAGTASE